MTYTYKCLCGQVEEVIKSVNQLDEEELCTRCGIPMKRIIDFSGQLSFGTFKAEYYHPFGKRLETKDQLNDELRRHKGETGKELIEVGNEKAAVSRTKWTPKPYAKEEAIKELSYRVKHG